MPFEGPGTGLANPSVLFHLSISQLAYLSVFRLVTVIGLSGVQLLCNHTSDKQNWTTAERKSDLLITSMITGRIEQHEVLLPITHNRFNFRKKQIHLGVISPAEAMSKVKKIWKFLNSLLG